MLDLPEVNLLGKVKSCGKRKAALGKEAYEEWFATRKDRCTVNHVGSSGMMEVETSKSVLGPLSIKAFDCQKSPIAYQLARDVTCINPENVKLPNASKRFHNLVKELHAKRWLSPDEVNDSLYQYKSMCSKVLENLTVETRLDQFYRALDLEGMDALKKVINMVLTMSHGNAEVERGFSVNKEVSVENMAERSIIARSCGKRKAALGKEAYEEWFATRKDRCTVNHVGSSGMMEVETSKSVLGPLSIKAFDENFVPGTRDALGIHLDFQKLCISIISKIAQKSPIAYQLARDVTCINPENVKLPNASERFHNLVKELHAKRWLSPDEVNDSLYQYKSMCSKVLENLTVETRLDQFYRALDLEGMDALKKVINMVLTMSHGNAEVERGFSVNKEVSVENMAERSIIARRLICQFIKDNGNCPAMVPLGKKMLTSCSGAYQKYKTSLEEERKKKELGEKTNTKKRKAEEKKGMDVKRRKLELDIDLLIRSADELSEEAEQKGTSGKEKVQVHELIVKSNALRKDAKAKKAELVQIDCSIKALEQELALL
ncbi:hypothetical protein EGW08_012345 [Elysia chlorotica]|uniref:Uncharacterized protein n=1 Tax=Elysia chlorotica TaxID=188477 RepID=A0A3S0ZKL2_ELYCH|nr:hypothetical protein EGW08_012345 [Elysia chlorotica]